MHRLLLPSALILLLGACAEPEPTPTEGDAVPERLLTASTLRAELSREGDWYVSTTLEAPALATRAGVLLTTLDPADETPRLEARGRSRTGEWGDWVRAEVTWTEAGQRVARADLGLVATGAQLRVHAHDLDTIADLLWSAVVPEPRPAGGVALPAPEVGGRSEALRAELADLVIGRATWGARAPVCRSADPSKYRMAIHHTVTPAGGDPAARIRGIQSFHIDTRGWCDIGYHFMVSLDGRLWEARELNDLGTHVGGHNSGNIGISFIGCFQNSGCNDWTPFSPPNAMVDSAATLVSRLAGLYGIEVTPTSVKGHRDHSGASTSCPGDNLHARLGDIRSGASTPPTYAAQYASQSFPLARDAFEVPAGTTEAGFIELRNVGTATWRPGETFLGTTEPRDGESVLAASDWISPSRAATVDREVPPGETGRFVMSVRAPETPGDYPQFFNLVQEGVAWFGDPGQGGPPDDQLQVRVTSVGWDAGPADAGVVEVMADGGVAPTADAGTARTAGDGDIDGGCGCTVPGGSRGATPLGLLAALVIFALVGRRRGILGQWPR